MAPRVRNGTGRDDGCSSFGSISVVVGLFYKKKERTLIKVDNM
jgi:hypothetical protein